MNVSAHARAATIDLGARPSTEATADAPPRPTRPRPARPSPSRSRPRPVRPRPSRLSPACVSKTAALKTGPRPRPSAVPRPRPSAPSHARERAPCHARERHSECARYCGRWCAVWVCPGACAVVTGTGRGAGRRACSESTAVALSARLDDAGASLPVCSHKLYLVRLMSAVCACCIPCRNLPRELAAEP